MSTENINITITSSGGAVVVRTIKDIAGAANDAIRPLAILQRSLHAVMGALAIRQIATWADEWTSAANKINVFTKSQAETNEVLDRVFKLAQNVRQPMADMVALYHRLSIGAKELGTTTNQNLSFTENIGKALAIQGTSATQARGALTQLSQAMGMGRIRAQEWNSMIENLPMVLLTVAKHTDGMGGSIARLRQKMLDGKLTSKDFFEAFQKGGPELAAMFAKTDKTFSQGMIALTDGITRYVGELNTALGVSNGFYAMTRFIAANLDIIGKLLVIVAAGVVGAFAPAIITAFTTALGGAVLALGRLTALLIANPFVIILAATAAVIAFGDSWDAGIDGITSVKDVFRATLEFIMNGLTTFGTWAATMWNGFIGGVEAAYEFVTGATNAAASGWASSYAQFFADVGTGFAGFVRGVAKTFDAIGGLILGFYLAIGRTIDGLPSLFANVFARVHNEIARYMEGAANVVIMGINKIRSAVGKDLLETVNFERMSVNEKAFETYGQGISDSIRDGFDMQGGLLLKSVDEIFGRAQDIAKKRTAEMVKPNVNLDLSEFAATDPTTKGGKGAAKAARELETLRNSLRTLLNQVDPASGAVLDMANAQETLTKSVSKGILTQDEMNRVLPLVKNHYRDIQDPLGKYIRDIEESTAVSGMQAKAREIEIELFKIEQDMFRKGRPMTTQQIQDMRERLTVQQKLNVQMQIQDSLLAASVDTRTNYVNQLAAINELLAKGTGGFNERDAKNAAIDLTPDLFKGTEEFVNRQMDTITMAFAKIRELEESGLFHTQTTSQMRMQLAEVERQRLMELQIEAANTRLQMGGEDWADVHLAALGKVREGYTTVFAGIAESMGGFFTSMTDGFANSIGAAIVNAKDLKTAMLDVAKSAVSQLISSLVKLGIQWAINAALGKTIAATAASTQLALTTATAMATAAAWAPAAAAVSLATMGANSAPAMAGITATHALSESMALMAAFENGGYTGNYGTKQIAGVVHGQEYVVNAKATSRNRGLLEAINNGEDVGASMGGSGSTGGLTVLIYNNGNNNVTAQEDEGPNGRELKIFIEETVRNDIDVGGPMSSMFEAQYQLNRANGINR